MGLTSAENLIDAAGKRREKFWKGRMKKENSTLSRDRVYYIKKTRIKP